MYSIIPAISCQSLNSNRPMVEARPENNRMAENQIESKWSARDTFYQQIASSGVAREKRKGEIVNSRRDKAKIKHGVGEEIIAHTNRS